MTNLSDPPLLTLYAPDEPKRKKKKKSQHLREQGLAVRQEDEGALTDGADFGMDIFPKVQIITLESI